ncbi:unnamed protein product [Mytilus coruscus]|uniref:Integrase zinc-binding domain-containing protein n=1 Tax=Mytilus coruscus TaxID=42192 RepID=A0A6J8DIB0_MYTCO|nr:unnamed protein product [Mytilus coruscus]
MLQPYTETELRDAQKNDIDLSTLIAWLSTDFSPSKQDLQMSSPFVRHLWQSKSQLEFRNSILYYFWDDAVAPRLLFITPRKLRQEMLHLCHDLHSAVHLGQDKTLAKLRLTVNWYGMTMDCKLYVSTCQICNRYKKTSEESQSRIENSLEDAHYIARENLKSTQKRLKQDYDLNLNFRKYCVGDIVLKLDTARKVGISPKLKAPWKGPYVVIEVKSPVLLKIKYRKREEVVHHDRLKLCIDKEIPLWLQRLRNDILGRVENKLEQNTNMDLEDLYLDILFSNENQNNQNDLNSLSESLTDGCNNDDPLFVSDSLTIGSKNERIILKSLHSLVDVPRNLDATFVYELSQNSPLPNHDDKNRDTCTLDNGSRRGQTGRRKKQMPSYLHDYVQ